MITPFYVKEENHQHHSSPPRGPRKRATHEVVIGATNRLLGALGTTPRTDRRDRGAIEADDTINVGKGEPKLSAELIEPCGGQLQVGGG